MTALSLQFEIYLAKTLGVSGKTLRNYRADLGSFLRWSKEHLKKEGVVIEDLDSLLPHFSEYLVGTYRTHHVQTGVPQATTNRRLSTLRNFGKFLAHSGVIFDNPASLVTNLKQEATHEQRLDVLVKEFSNHLNSEGVSKVTSKNYLSDVRHFVAWLAKQDDWIKEQEVQSH